MAVAPKPFIITELDGGDPTGADNLERFEWTAGTTAPSDKGGARAAPKGGPWSHGGTQKTVRTDYPNSKTPSEQILGPRRKPFTLRGQWLDKWNFEGYAEAEKDRFEAMCQRGRLIRFAHGNQVLEGIITEWDCDYQRPWDIAYSFTVSVHSRPQETNKSRQPTTTKTPSDSADDVILLAQAMLDDQQQMSSRSLLKGKLATDIDQNLTAITESRAAMASTIDNRELNPPEKPSDSFARIASQFRQVRSDAYAVVVRLADVRADLDMSVLTAIGVLDFEDWSRTMRYHGRITVRTAHLADLASTEQAEPSAARLYRPRKGESLYNISRRFYGTPHAWSLIYDRNALTTFSLLGTETLIIPERGGV